MTSLKESNPALYFSFTGESGDNITSNICINVLTESFWVCSPLTAPGCAEEFANYFLAQRFYQLRLHSTDGLTVNLVSMQAQIAGAGNQYLFGGKQILQVIRLLVHGNARRWNAA